MKIITEKQFNDFAGNFFPGKAIHYDKTYAFIQAGSCLGDNLHYECDETSVNLHIEGPEWRPIRDYLNANLNKERLTPSHWGRQNCQWTIDNEIHTAADVMQAFLDIRSIIEPVIEQFEGKEPQDYSGITLLQHDWNDSTNSEIQTLKKQTKEPDNLLALMSDAAQNNAMETTLVNTEEKTPLYRITPINPQPITIERTIKETGMTFSKTYNQLASAPIQGIDTAGRRTFKVELSPLASSNDIKKVSLSHKINFSDNLKKMVVECFAAVQTQNEAYPSYNTLLWKYLANDHNIGDIQMEKGYALKSTFGVVSLIPSFTYQFSVSKDDEVSKAPSLCLEERYCTTNLTPEELVSIFDKENMVEIHDDEIIFKSKYFSNLHTIVGSYKTPKAFNNICPDCYGAKKLRCGRCHGTGREQYQEGEYADGRPKIKTGQCGKCYGRGYFVCNTCNETGKIDQGTGMIQIQEMVNSKLKLKERTVISNTFFNTKNAVSYNEIKHIQTLEQASRNKKETIEKLREAIDNACKHVLEDCENQLNRYKDYVDSKEVESIDSWSMIGSEIKIKKFENHQKILADYYQKRTMFSNLKKLLKERQYSQAFNIIDVEFSGVDYSGIIFFLDEINNLKSSKVANTNHLSSSYHQLYKPENVEIIFNEQTQSIVDNNHLQISSLTNNLGKDLFNFLYYQNLQKAQDAFKLDNTDERIIGILEKHWIDDSLLKITIPLENEKVFVVYYSNKENSLYYLGELPTISSVVKQFEEEKRIVKEKKLEQERLIDEKRQKTYSQSMDTLLDKDKTTKTGLFSKLFNTKEYKQHKDAEKAIKLMIYVAKADSTLDVDEKEFLTKKITKDLNDGYTERTRQEFLFLLNDDSIPDLTTEDCTFRSRDVAKRVLDNLVKLAKANGTVAKEECSMLKLIASKMDLENYLEKLL